MIIAKVITRLIAIVVFLIYTIITALPFFVFVILFGWEKTEKYWGKVIEWCIKKIE